MTRIRKAIVLLWAVGCLAPLALSANSSDDAFAKIDQMRRDLNGSCSYSVLEEYRENRELLCQLDALRKRCNKIDDCYVYCIGRNVGESIGGGCTHLCNYRLKVDWSPPESAKACLKN